MPSPPPQRADVTEKATANAIGSWYVRRNYWEWGPLSHQRHTDWRCSTTAWRRGKWRPVVSLRVGPASKFGLGVFIERGEDGVWCFNLAGLFFDVVAQLSGPSITLDDMGDGREP